ncbi:MAG: FMN-binding protein [Fidelibacterota bacterium]
MTKSNRLIIVLTATAILSGLLLSFLNIHTLPLIEAHQKQVLNDALSSVLPNGVQIEAKTFGNRQYYFGYDEQQQLRGVAFLAEGNGFQSKLRILVGMDPALTTITKIQILEQKETPGLGTKIDTDPGNKTNPQWFAAQFDRLNARKPLTYIKNQKPDKSEGEIMAITGATISSKAVIDIINASIQNTRKVLSSQTDPEIADCEDGETIKAENFNPELLFPGAEVTTIDNKIFLLKNDSNDAVSEVAFVASGEGFQSRIRILVCMNPGFNRIKRIEILEQNETPGWGTRIIDDTTRTDAGWFLKQFRDLAVADGVVRIGTNVNRQEGTVQTISGATVSSEAIIRILNDALKEYRDAYLNQKVN